MTILFIVVALIAIVAFMGIVDPCSTDSLINSAKCINCFSKTEKQAALVYWLAQELKASGGTDYTNLGTLESATACFKCEPTFMLDSFDVVIAQDAATAAGATTLTTTQLRAAIKCMVCTDPKFLRTAETFLRCKLANQLHIL